MTVQVAGADYGTEAEEATRDAWKAVGINVNG